MKKKLLVSCVCVLITAWGLKSTSTSVSAETPSTVKQLPSDTKTSPAVQPQVELLNAGAEPRQELRFKPTVNAKQTTTMNMDIDMAMSISGQSSPNIDFPATVMTMETVVTKVDASGDIHYQFSYSDVDVVGNTSVPSNVIDSIRSQLKKIVGLSGSVIVDNRGQTKQASFVLPQGLDESTKQTIEQMSNSLEQLSSPLPSEAIGMGAKWRVSSSPSLGGINLTQIATYELVSLQNGVATLNVTIEQQAAPQKFNRSELPPKVTLTLESYDSQGQGQVTMPLNRLVPIRSNVSMRSNSEMNIQEAGKAEATTMGTKLFIEMTLESK